MLSKKILPDGCVRLEKYIAQHGLCSRREGKALIIAGKISVNNKVIREPGYGINPANDVVLRVGESESKTTVALYKPRGVETIKTDLKNKDIHDVFPQYKKLAPIGRLDKDSEGLILLSNDGLVSRAITGEHSSVDKEYRVSVREVIDNIALKKMTAGILLDGQKTLPAVVKKISTRVFSVVLHEGRKHQIRRMADACRLTIEQLVRVRVGSVKLGSLKAGQSRNVTKKELEELLG